MLSGHERKPRSGNARQLVVILHGWGADGANLIDLADLWANHLPDAHFIAPNAHEVCEVNPYGFQWFSLMDRSPLEMYRGVEAAAVEVNAFLDAKLAEIAPPLGGSSREQAHQGAAQGVGGMCSSSEALAHNVLNPSRLAAASKPGSSALPQGEGRIKLALVGFSQGTMTALHVGLQREDVACVLGYSGSLLADESSIRMITHKPPVCLIHGEQDDVVPFTSLARAKDLLEAQRIDVQTYTRPGLGHSIDMEGIALGGMFLSAAVKQ